MKKIDRSDNTSTGNTNWHIFSRLQTDFSPTSSMWLLDLGTFHGQGGYRVVQLEHAFVVVRESAASLLQGLCEVLAVVRNVHGIRHESSGCRQKVFGRQNEF
jgi:hypothetical protein